MGFDWEKYLQLADELAQRTREEAALRSAISRAYYAIYCSARNQLFDEGITIPENVNQHDEVWKKFKRASGQTRKKIGNDGARLRRQRKNADYDEEVQNLQSETQGSVRTAKTVMYWLKTLKTKSSS